MPVYFDKTKGRWRFKFERIINGQPVRATKVLPKGWTGKQADAFDKDETARLYALATGVEKQEPLIEDAVLLYCEERCPQLKHGKEYINQLKADFDNYKGKKLSELPEVAKAIRKEPVKPATQRNRIAYIRSACRYAFKQGIGEHDPAERLTMPKVKNERHNYPTRKEMLQIARKATRKDVRAIIRIAFYSGLRQGEVRRAVAKDGKFIVYDTKNGSAVHSVPIHSKVRSSAKLMPFNIPRSTFARAFEKAREAAGLKHVHHHDIRHSAASEMINAGVDLYTVGKVLGHKDTRSTQRYAHLQTAALEDAINKIGTQ